MASANKHFRGEWPYLVEHYECTETGEVPKVFSEEKYAVQTEEVRKANAKGKSDALIVLMITGNAGEGKESYI